MSALQYMIVEDGDLADEFDAILNYREIIGNMARGKTVHKAIQSGWTYVSVNGRDVLWRGPVTWTQGAIVILHGGGGKYTDFAVPEDPLLTPQIDFATDAIAAGFGVFLLDSSNDVTALDGGLIGKVWDSDPPAYAYGSRANLDTAFIQAVLTTTIPGVRPGGSSTERFLVGHSSGAMMTVRIMAEYGSLLTKVALLSPVDPYGNHRVSTPRGDRSTVFGIMEGNYTDLEISVAGSGGASPYALGEETWGADTPKPLAKIFYNSGDAVVNITQFARLQYHLVAKEYTAEGSAYALADTPSVYMHLWLDRYNSPLLSYLTT